MGNSALPMVVARRGRHFFLISEQFRLYVCSSPQAPIFF
jgi:hypothetical protein